MSAPYSQAYLLRGSTSSTQHRLALTAYGNIRVDTSTDGGQNWEISYYATHNGDTAQDPLPIERGGTGASNVSDARNNLQVPSTANVWLASTSRTANTVLAAPNGSAGGAGFRSLVAADLPTVTIAKGGTGATDRVTAFKNITNGNVGTSANYFVTFTSSWGSAGYSSVANTKSVLGMKCTQLYSGTFKSGSTTFSAAYEFFIIFGTSGGGARESVVVPKAAMGSSDMTVLISDEASYLSVKVKYSGATATMTFDANKNASGATMTSGSILRVYGVLTQ